MSMQADEARRSMKRLCFGDSPIQKRVLFGVAIVFAPMLLMALMLAVSLLSLQANVERLHRAGVDGADATMSEGVPSRMTPDARDPQSEGHGIRDASIEAQSRFGGDLRRQKAIVENMTSQFLVLGALVLLSAVAALLLIPRSVAAPVGAQARTVEKPLVEPLVTPLEEAVARRTSELSAAMQRSDAANRAKSAFLTTVSHELRTPLNAVLGYAELLRADGSLNARQMLGLDTIRHSGEHLLLLTNDILDLAKVEAGKLDLVPSPVQMDDFLRVLGDIVRIKADQKGISFVIDCMPGLSRAVSVDKRRLRQVLLNLLANAVKFTERGHVTLIVRHTPKDNTTVRLNFAVQDTGIGIEPDQLSRIFEPFEQVGEPRRRIDGAGLGLTISRQLVRLMHGEISVESRPGEGSCFCFELSVPVVDTCDQSTRQEVAST